VHRKDIFKTIIYECMAGDGFLSQLRARNYLPNKFEDLVNALKDYRELVRNKDYMERAVAYCVYILDFELSASLDYFQRNEEERLIIENATEICTPLIHEILAPEWMTGPLPEEYK
jgi:hypothetical protein